ncbi:MAG: TadE/TadG family type IV pilus assembly protein [Pseudomonadota bacterium]
MRLKTSLRKSVKSEDGTISVEFVLIVPLLLMVLGIGFGTFHAYLQYARASKAMYTVSDIVARYETLTDAKMVQLQQVYESFTSAPPGSIIRVSRIDFALDADDLPDPDAKTYSHNDGLYTVTWSLSSPKETVAEPCAVCPNGEALKYALISDQLQYYELPRLGDGAHIMLFEVYTPYFSPIPEGVTLGVDFRGVAWSMNHFVWPRGANGITYEAG